MATLRVIPSRQRPRRSVATMNLRTALRTRRNSEQGAVERTPIWPEDNEWRSPLALWQQYLASAAGADVLFDDWDDDDTFQLPLRSKDATQQPERSKSTKSHCDMADMSSCCSSLESDGEVVGYVSPSSCHTSSDEDSDGSVEYFAKRRSSVLAHTSCNEVRRPPRLRQRVLDCSKSCALSSTCDVFDMTSKDNESSTTEMEREVGFAAAAEANTPECYDLAAADSEDESDDEVYAQLAKPWCKGIGEKPDDPVLQTPPDHFHQENFAMDVLPSPFSLNVSPSSSGYSLHGDEDDCESIKEVALGIKQSSSPPASDDVQQVDFRRHSATTSTRSAFSFKRAVVEQPLPSRRPSMVAVPALKKPSRSVSVPTAKAKSLGAEELDAKLRWRLSVIEGDSQVYGGKSSNAILLHRLATCSRRSSSLCTEELARKLEKRLNVLQQAQAESFSSPAPAG